jgi:hypothetical protein
VAGLGRRGAAGVALLLVGSLSLTGCAGLSGKKRSRTAQVRDGDVVRYRLRLRDNPVDSAGAFRCFGACQPEATPTGYLGCLEACPGFDITPGYRCADDEVPPLAACLTARKVDADDEVDPGMIVLSVVAGVALVVAAASVCAATTAPSQCQYGTFPPPGPLGPPPPPPPPPR